jgi:hypothetical protein
MAWCNLLSIRLDDSGEYHLRRFCMHVVTHVILLLSNHTVCQVLAMELDALGRWQHEQRSKRQQLQPLWRVMALLADAWSRDHIQKRLT